MVGGHFLTILLCRVMVSLSSQDTNTSNFSLQRKLFCEHQTHIYKCLLDISAWKFNLNMPKKPCLPREASGNGNSIVWPKTSLTPFIRWYSSKNNPQSSYYLCSSRNHRIFLKLLKYPPNWPPCFCFAWCLNLFST